jgi:hypothetical protein
MNITLITKNKNYDIYEKKNDYDIRYILTGDAVIIPGNDDRKTVVNYNNNALVIPYDKITSIQYHKDDAEEANLIFERILHNTGG